MAWCRMRRRNVNILATPIPVNKVDHMPENISQSSARTQAPTAYHESVDQTTSPSLISPQTKAHSPQSPLEPNFQITNKEATNAFKQALEPEFNLQKDLLLQI